MYWPRLLLVGCLTLLISGCVNRYFAASCDKPTHPANQTHSFIMLCRSERPDLLNIGSEYDAKQFCQGPLKIRVLEEGTRIKTINTPVAGQNLALSRLEHWQKIHVECLAQNIP